MSKKKTLGQEIKERIEHFIKDKAKEKEKKGQEINREKLASLSVPLPERPKKEGVGELATDVAFKLAPVFREPPEKIANELAQTLSDFNPEVIKGFVNLKIPVRKSVEFILGFRKPDILHGKKILVEFVSANPTGPLHIGHGRIAAVGNALSNILEFCGGKVEREFYINDAGEQVEKLGKTIMGEGQEYRADYIERLREELREELSSVNPENSGRMQYEIGFRASRIVLEWIKKTLEEFGVKFNRFVSEKEVSEKFLDEAIRVMKEDGDYLYKKDGAWFFRTTAFGDDKDRVVIKSDGKPTYFGNDCAYHLYKIKRGYDILIEVWGADHHGYIKRISAFLRKAGFKGEFIVKLVQMVNLIKDGRPVQMSKREGTFITLDELIKEVGADATKFIYLTRNSDTHLDFDIDLAKKKSMENPVYYVQYTHARICSIFREAQRKSLLPDYIKWKEKVLGEGKAVKISTPSDFDEERELLGLSSIFFDEVLISAGLKEPSRITSFLLSLASAYHSFYQKKRVLVPDDDELRHLRLFVSEVVRDTVKRGLSLLGVSAPERM